MGDDRVAKEVRGVVTVYLKFWAPPKEMDRFY